MSPETNFTNRPKDYTKDGRCSRCAGCCSSVIPVTDEELAVMKKYADGIGFEPRIPEGGGDTIYMMCPFLVPGTAVELKRTCAVYPVRPAICRVFRCNKSNAETHSGLVKALRGKPVPRPVNVWKIYNKTGLRKGGAEIPYENETSAVLERPDGSQVEIRVGRPLNVLTYGGDYYHAFLCVGILPDAVQIAGGPEIKTIPYEDLKEVL